MESRARFLGHPIHPMLIVFPLGLLTTAVIFDLIGLVVGIGELLTASYWMIAAGVLAGLAAAAFGAWDWLHIPRGTRARAIAMWHGLGNVAMVALFATSWLLRRPEPTDVSTAALALGLIGAGLATLTGWLGGELVFRLGIAVDPGAGLNAPSSLARPAAGTSRKYPPGRAV